MTGSTLICAFSCHGNESAETHCIPGFARKCQHSSSCIYNLNNCVVEKKTNKLMPSWDQWTRQEQSTCKHKKQSLSINSFGSSTMLFSYWCELKHRGLRSVKKWFSVSGKLCRHYKANLAVMTLCLSSPLFTESVQNSSTAWGLTVSG